MKNTVLKFELMECILNIGCKRLVGYEIYIYIYRIKSVVALAQLFSSG